jgi:hypothetical protein
VRAFGLSHNRAARTLPMSPRPGSLRSHDGQDFWRGLAVVTLDVGSISIRHSASSRLASAGALPPDQNQRLVAASTRLAGAPPALISADWNGSAQVLGGPATRPGAVGRRTARCRRADPSRLATHGRPSPG